MIWTMVVCRHGDMSDLLVVLWTVRCCTHVGPATVGHHLRKRLVHTGRPSAQLSTSERPGPAGSILNTSRSDGSVDNSDKHYQLQL
jgi:hypothetical protein